MCRPRSADLIHGCHFGAEPTHFRRPGWPRNPSSGLSQLSLPADAPCVSYDLFAQAFAHGDGVQDPQIVDVILDVLRPFLVGSTDEKGFCRTRVSDGGEADFYVGLDGHGFMVNHFSPGETTELIVRAAQAARLVVLGPGLPPVLTDAHQLAELPEPLSVGAPMPVLVETAEELEGLIADDPETYRRCRERLTSRS
jgi:hypothetical protein